MHPRNIAVTAVVALVVAACGGGGDDRPADADMTVVAEDFAFDPTTLELDPGTASTVALENRDETRHSFTVDSLGVDVEAGPGESATVEVVPTEGPAEFYCRFHPDRMRGEINPEDPGAGSDASPEGGGGGGYGDY